MCNETMKKTRICNSTKLVRILSNSYEIREDMKGDFHQKIWIDINSCTTHTAPLVRLDPAGVRTCVR